MVESIQWIHIVGILALVITFAIPYHRRLRGAIARERLMRIMLQERRVRERRRA
jgi:hypothetical protein